MKKKKFNLSIRTNIFISMVSLTVVMLSILWILQAIFFNTLYKATKEKDIERASNLIVDSIGTDNIEGTINQIINEYDVCLKVYKYETAEILYSPECISNGCIIHQVKDLDLFNNCINGINNVKDFESEREKIFYETKNAESGDDFLLLSRMVEDSKGVKYLLVLNTSIEPVQATISAIRAMLIILSVLFLLTAVLVSFILAKRLTSPIIKMNNDARKLARANYDIDFTSDGPIEIRELSKSLNIAARELGKLDSMQKELIANISHDLRTPLTMISGYAEVMRDIPDENTPENLQVIVDESARLTSLVNDLLNVSKLQAGTQTMNIQEMNLTKAVASTVERYARFKEHNDFNIIFEYDREVYINADEIRLLQVIYNLINNAINYTGQDKTVIVTQTIENDIVRISVKDSGEGIKEEDLPLIWDRYYKVDKIHKRAVIGTGLGLSIVKNILLLHGSRFGVSSELKKGSIFWFEFKIVE